MGASLSIFEGLPHDGYEKYHQVILREQPNRYQGVWLCKMDKVKQQNPPMCLVGYNKDEDLYCASFINTDGNLDFCCLVSAWFERDYEIDQKLLECTKAKEKTLIREAKEQEKSKEQMTTQAKSKEQMSIMERLDHIEKAIGLQK